MSTRPAVTLCIINYNGAEHLKEAFRALQEQDWPFSEILLIDNASDDDSREVARDLCPEVNIVCLPSNLGPGAARNAGFHKARNDLILFQDNDVRLCTQTVAELTKQLALHLDTLLVTPRVLYAHDPDTVQYDSADCHFLGLMTTRHADTRVQKLDVVACTTTSMVSACFLIDRKCWKEKHLFDESFGFNLEDHDFAVRSCIAGYSLWVQPQAQVLHGTGTPGLSYRPGNVASEQRLYYLVLNRWIVVSKCYATKTIVILFPALLVYEFMQLVWMVGRGSFRTWFRALSAYRVSRKRVLADRKSIQRNRQVADRDVLRDAPLPFTHTVNSGVVTRSLVTAADYLMRGYWRLVRRWI
jgi:GT2 family glycosyltransferase